MSLLTETLSRLSGQRLVELTNADNPGGLRATPVTGTVAVAQGTVFVTGTGTTFLTSVLPNTVIQFASQPGVNYVVTSVLSNTSLTLQANYFGAAAASTTATLPAINYNVLQQASFDAQAHFQTRTNFPFDDITANANTNPLTLNKCIWAGISLVVAYLYEYRAHPWPEAEVANAWSTADRRLNEVLHVYGDGAFAAPATDSVFQPSIGPARLPTFDNARFGDLSPLPPGPSISGGGGATSDWGGV